MTFSGDIASLDMLAFEVWVQRVGRGLALGDTVGVGLCLG